MDLLQGYYLSEQIYNQITSLLSSSRYEIAPYLRSPLVSHVDIEELTQAFDNLTLGTDHFPILTSFGTHEEERDCGGDEDPEYEREEDDEDDEEEAGPHGHPRTYNGRGIVVSHCEHHGLYVFEYVRGQLLNDFCEACAWEGEEEVEEVEYEWQDNDVAMENFDGVPAYYPYGHYDHDHAFGSCASCFPEEDIIE